MAKRGVLFSHAYVQSPIYIPTRACLHTGRYIHQHGVQYVEEVIDWPSRRYRRFQLTGEVKGGKICL
ncbi:TPA: hypothetical protein EYP37_07300 [Candidatus Poribacteria bacterium]|nr:hypothetical protein [Candidatus Poribacteria bacterium]